MPTKYFLYARKSTEDEERQVMSIEAQLIELQEFAKRENIEIAQTFVESKSAKKPGREVFNEMMLKVHESHEPIGLLSWHPDRLARNSVDGGQIIYLIDTGKIVSLKFPTFWFEPTPQGLFMLQVAFGQSKYYSDNLSENVKRGIRQKLRRGEVPHYAPIGYTNNPKTRNIEPDETKARIIRKGLEEYAKGNHTLQSLSERLSFWGLTSKDGNPLGKATIQRMITNPTYCGLIVHNGETYEGIFAPIITKALFDRVQKVYKVHSRPRKSRKSHDFPLTGLFTCDECGGAITAQYAKGKRYRYYRCSKKLGKCSQPYVREEMLVEQLREYVKQVALPSGWKEPMLAKIHAWGKQEGANKEINLREITERIEGTKQRLDNLVNAFLDATIDKETYLKKKDELIHTKTRLLEEKASLGKQGSYWLEPLRAWILAADSARNLQSSNNLRQIKSFVETIGTNRHLRLRKAQFLWAEEWKILAEKSQGIFWSGTVNDLRNYFSTTTEYFALPDLRELPSDNTLTENT